MLALPSSCERTKRPMYSAAVCQPLAISPPNGPSAAASGFDVERLRVELAREADDVLRGHLDRPVLGLGADGEVLPVAEPACLGHASTLPCRRRWRQAEVVVDVDVDVVAGYETVTAP
jgi:hypothetical protein